MKRPALSLAFIFGLSLATAVPVLAADCTPFAADHLTSAGEYEMSINPTLPPQQYIDQTGELKGLNVDLTAAMAKELCLKPVFMRMDASNMIPGLQGKRFDMVNTGLFWTEERAKTMFMVPYGNQAFSVLVAPRSTIDWSQPEDMAGHNVATEVNSYPYKMAHQLSDQLVAKGLKPINVQGFNNGAESLAALHAGQVDAILSPNTTAADIVKRGGGKELMNQLWASQICFVFRDKALAEASAEALTKLKADGTYDKVFDTYGMSRLDTKTFAVRGPSKT